MTSIFTKIINREIPSSIVYEDENIIVIHDIHPQAKTHLLIIPKEEIQTVNDFTENHALLISHMFFVAQKITKEQWIDEGYKLHINVWEKWGQEVPHVHMHLLSDI